MDAQDDKQPEETVKRDWEALCIEYVTTPISLTELADKHGIPRPTVQWHSSRELWVNQRNEFLQETSRETLRKIRLRYSQERVRDYERLEGAAIQLTKQIVQGKPVKFVMKDDDGNPRIGPDGKPLIVEFYAELAANSLDAAANALINVSKAKAVMAGEADSVQRQELTGANGGPVETRGEVIVTTDDHTATVLGILAGCGALEPGTEACPVAEDDEVHTP